MNTNFLSIISRIIAEQGEAILAEPQRLKGFVRDYAANVPQEERRAFGRCIERGYYLLLKKTRSVEERRRLIIKFAAELQAADGLNSKLCTDALYILEAAVFTTPANTHSKFALPKIFTKILSVLQARKKIITFALAAGFAAFLGDSVAGDIRYRLALPETFWGNILEMAIWVGVLSPFVIIALVCVQHLYQKKLPQIKIIIPIILGIISGAFSSGFAQFVFHYTQRISPLVKNVSNALCWGIMGTGLALGVSLFVPNYPKKRAALAGALGGTIGGAIYVLTMSVSYLGSIIGVIVLGLCLGFAIAFVEETLREAWLTVIWGPKEQSTLSLGKKPVTFGSAKNADIFLPRSKDKPNEPDVRAIFSIENGKIFVTESGQRKSLQNGSRVDLGKITVVVNIKNKEAH